MNTTITVPPPAAVETMKRLPLATLVALAVIGFVLVAMETMSAGLRPVIAGLTAVAIIAGALIAAIAPAAHGQPGSSRLPLVRVFRIPGIAIILAVIFT
ncbi:hypothetical protein [Cryobacterium sp. GrIS_2_6]|uniref:hypothetical protein n=1 Tax=Cryobacterium sp. GrIS_2_6 TaxID=3162785 RepID=UPI002E082178|nr:Flp pilus assembly pilin Flp [Cryobacterium psychrotolerans]